jgi:hypothetical protein
MLGILPLPLVIPMRRCVECGRAYRGGLNASALLKLALDEMGDSG